MHVTEDTTTAAPPQTVTKKEGTLPLLARLYVGGVIAAGALVFIYCATHVHVTQSALFLSLIVLSCLASALKIRLPLTRSASTMSVSYVVDFTALLLLGPEQTVFVAAASAIAQSTLNVRKGNPHYRTIFNISAIVLTIEFAGLVFGWSGGGAGNLGWPQIATPLLAAATAYYLANTASVSIAVALTSGQQLIRVWNDNFLWCAPSYFVGAAVAMVSATIVNGANQWLLPILIPPVYLTFRSYKVYLGRLEDEQRHTQQVTELHDQAQQALKFAQQSEGKLRETLQLLKQSEERYALAAAGSNDGLWDWDVVRNRVYFSPRWKAMLGLSDDEVGNTLLDWLNRVHPDEVEGLRAALGAHLAGETPHLEHEHRIQTAAGAYRWMLCRGIAVRDADGTATRLAGSQTDVTDRHEAQARLEHAARHDSLTNLPNRSAFMQELGRILGRSKRMSDYRYSVLFVDVDRFKLVNDSLGHLIGDQLLTAVAHKLATCLRTGDVLARLGGDEFTILLDGVNGPGDVEFVAERVQSLFREPMKVDSGREIFVTTSIGIAMGGPHYEHPEELLRDADTAMYRAKALGKACHVVFEQRMRDHAVVRLNLETELRRAIENDELKLFYQPVIALKNGALVRFRSASPLGTCRRRDDSPVRVHSACGRNRRHRSARHLGPWRGLSAGGAVAAAVPLRRAAHDERQHLAAPADAAWNRRSRWTDAAEAFARARYPCIGNYRERSRRGRRDRDEGHQGTEDAPRAAAARRFRYRVFVPRPPAPLPRRHGQDRSLVPREGSARSERLECSRRRRLARAESWQGRHRRGNRDRRAGRAATQAALPPRPGFLLLEAGRRHRSGRDHRARERDDRAPATARRLRRTVGRRDARSLNVSGGVAP